MIKNILLSTYILTIVPGRPLPAQAPFPEGASWTYSYGTVSGPEVYHAKLEVTEVTNEAGKIISKIELTEDLGAGLEMCQILSLPSYAYTSNDSIFYTTAADSTYRLAALTNAEAGDSWYIAAAIVGSSLIDSNFVEVISTEEITVGSGTLKQMTCEVTPEQGYFELMSPVVILERIGSVSSLLFPLGLSAACDGVNNIQLVCYNDAEIEYVSPAFGSCFLNTSDFENSLAVTLFPNPATAQLNFSADKPIHNIRIFDAVGRNVLTTNSGEISNGVINITELKNGFYIAVFGTAEGEVRKKFIVEK